MQKIMLYATANETLASVRDSANARSASSPVFVRGVEVELHLRLFANANEQERYAMPSGIVSYGWYMDVDFDTTTAFKIVGDNADIVVDEVPDTVDSETGEITEYGYTDIKIPITNMNSRALVDWLGTEKSKSGLIGELCGYDSTGASIFVLQIEGFTVRNRLSGSGEPTSQSQDLITRTEAQNLIQSAISGATVNVSNVVSAASAGYASTAGEASGLTSAAKADIIASAGGGSGGTGGIIVYSGGTADYASAAGTASALVSDYIVSSASAATVASSLPEAVYSSIVSSIVGSATTSIQSGGTAYYASSAATAGEASGLTSAAKADIIASAGGGSGGTGGIIVYSGGTADYASAAGVASSAGFASSAGGLTSNALAFVIELTSSGTVDNTVDGYKEGSAFEDLYEQGAFGGVVMVKDIHPGANGIYPNSDSLNQFAVPTAAAVYSHCLYNGPFAVHNDDGPLVNISAGAVVIGGSRYTVSASSATISSGYRLWLVGSSGASSATFAYSAVVSGSSPVLSSSGMFAHCICGRHGPGEADVQQYQYGDIITVPWGVTASGAGGYNGPFAVGVTSAGITVAGGRMYLGGAEYAVGSTTLTSSNGTVYYYVYYSSGSYYSGCSVAASASALAAVIRGSQGYFTALANVSGGVVTQCHYGDIRIDGRVV